MKLLKKITDKDFGFEYPEPDKYKVRHAARAIVFDDDDNVGMFHATKNHYHKLPGGGIEAGEDQVSALRREILEEIGCKIKDIQELGIVEEFRNKLALNQISHTYIARVDGEKGEPDLDKGEADEGFVPEWMSLDEAIATLENEGLIEMYEGSFMRLRDLTFLKEAKRVLDQQ